VGRPPARLTLAVLLAVSAAAGGRVGADEDIPAMGAGETWREVPMDPLRQAERQCQIPDR
jgi:hypothetical protein